MVNPEPSFPPKLRLVRRSERDDSVGVSAAGMSVDIPIIKKQGAGSPGSMSSS
jgi:hypothetical protein